MNDQELLELGLHPQRVKQHQSRICHALGAGEQPQLQILDTCRLDNGGVLPIDWLVADKQSGDYNKIGAFVPAAGASSRYFKAYSAFESKLQQADRQGVYQALQALQALGAASWPLPELIKPLIATPQLIETTDLQALRQDLGAVKIPKAFMPCTRDQASFLDLKLWEHDAIGQLGCQAFITPPGLESAFEARLQESSAPKTIPMVLLEQGPELSTIRFDQKAEPFRASSGQLSLVPAGHGTLVHLFAQVQAKCSELKALFIRNIDNVMGRHPEAVQASCQVLNTYNQLLEHMEFIRAALSAPESERALLTQAAAVCSELCLKAPQLSLEDQSYIQEQPEQWQPFYKLQCQLFQTPVGFIKVLVQRCEGHQELLSKLFARPLNILGQVPNSGCDVGGTPVYIHNSREGYTQKICIELPHASAEDRKTYLEDPQKATHFNPVFAVSEIFDGQHYEQDDDLWLLAQKPFLGETAYYHESVLYELIGNNVLANLLFMEVPRAVFHPHKSVEDQGDRVLADWGCGG